MSDYKLITECPPGKDCPKVVLAADGEVVIVGEQITDEGTLTGVGPGEAAVRVTVAMYRAGYGGLEGEDGEAA